MITVKQNKTKKLNDYVVKCHDDIFEDSTHIGSVEGYLLDVGKMKQDKANPIEIFAADGSLAFFGDHYGDMTLKNKVFIFKNFSLLNQHQRKLKGVEALRAHHDLCLDLGCQQLIAYPFPLYEDQSIYKTNPEKVKTDKEFLVNHYISIYTYKGNCVRHGDTGIIIKNLI